MQNTRWEYRIVQAQALADFERALNEAGAEGWEAIAGAYGMGEAKRASLGQGMPISTQAGVSTWTAVMKRPKAGGQAG